MRNVRSFSEGKIPFLVVVLVAVLSLSGESDAFQSNCPLRPIPSLMPSGSSYRSIPRHNDVVPNIGTLLRARQDDCVDHVSIESVLDLMDCILLIPLRRLIVASR